MTTQLGLSRACGRDKCGEQVTLSGVECGVSAALPLPQRHHSVPPRSTADPSSARSSSFLFFFLRVLLAFCSCWRRGEFAEGAGIGGDTTARVRKVSLRPGIRLGKSCGVSCFQSPVSLVGKLGLKILVESKIVCESTRNGLIIRGLFVYIFAAKTTIKMS